MEDLNTKREFLDGRVALMPGDCRESLKSLPDNSVDSVVCDPPYALDSIRKRFGGNDAAPAQHGTDGAFARASRGFMGKQWDTGDVAFDADFWRDVFRVLKPGGYLVAFSGTRTYHHMATAIARAGFEVRDSLLNMLASDTAVSRFMDTLNDSQLEAFIRCLEESEFGGMLAWCYGTGFPKSHNISKAIDRFLGVAATVVGKERLPNDMRNSALLNAGKMEKGGEREAYERDVTVPTSPQAQEWGGWGTALKPAWEPIMLARKPIAENSVAENCMAHGTGAINTNACRVDAEKPTGWGGKAGGGKTWNESNSGLGKDGAPRPVDGRFPANVITDGSEEVAACFPSAAGQQRPVTGQERAKRSKNVYGDFGATREGMEPRGDAGSAVRFFYSAKADGDDRLGSMHPTVKPVDLMRWLVRLVTRKGGTVLDPFAGTGTTGEAAYWEGCNAILCEREEEYQGDIARRMSLVLAGPEEKKRARTKAAPPEETPLFGWTPNS